MLKFKNVLSLFDGASCAQMALRRAGIDYQNYYASEINENAIKVSSKNFPKTIHLGDVTKINYTKLPKFDFIFAGSPCQNFSGAGRRDGMVTLSGKNVHDYDTYIKYKNKGEKFTESCLFWEVKRAMIETDCDNIFFENTKMKGFYLDLISKELGVEPILLNSSILTAQNRERHYWSKLPGFKMPTDKEITFDTIVPKGVSSGYRGRDFGDGRGYVRTYSKRKDGKANCLVCRPYSTNYVDINGNRRIISVEEAIQLQTWPKNYLNIDGLSKTAKYEMLGNGWTVDMVSHFLKCAKNTKRKCRI